MLEKSFNHGHYQESYYNLNSSTVTSTIAIDISTDGEYVASSHGDHTIKVFDYLSGEQIRNFHGHPRTPWTVKFNPKDSNIVASGCLGFEARIWNIELNTCLNVMKYDFSIITMSFHPSAELLAVASGQMLRFWNWRKLNRLSQAVVTSAAVKNLKEQELKYRSNDFYCRSIANERSIRAVVFHPSGNYIFIAAPYLKRDDKRYALSHSGLTPCRLYCVNYRDLFDDRPKRVLDLQSQPILLSEMHVYSDGGIDISRDGRYLVVCGMLLVPKPMEYIAAAETLRAHFKHSSNSSFSRVFPDRIAAEEAAASDSTPMLAAFRLSTNLQAASLQRVADIEEASSNEPSSNHTAVYPPPNPQMTGQGLLSLGQQSTSFIPRFSTDTRSNFLETLSAAVSSEFRSSSRPGSLRLDPTNASEGPASSATASAAAQNLYSTLPPTPLTSRSLPIRHSSGVMLKEHICLFELVVDKQPANAEDEISSANSSPRGMASMTTSASQIYANDEAEVVDDEYTECHAISTQELSVSLLQCKPLTSSLMKAIVSSKFSPSGRYVALGYGVRTSAKEVEDHVNKRVACEIVDTQSHGLESVAFFTHPEDEVNVSVFHPLPGLGLVYGTKTGKLRVFRRAFAEMEEEDEHDRWIAEQDDSDMEIVER